jgi:hypothetical protein
MKRISKRKYKVWASPIRLLMGEGDRAIEFIRECAEDTKDVRKELPKRGGRGRPTDKWREKFIEKAVTHLLNKYPKLDASKNKATEMPLDQRTKKPIPENACAIVAEGLRRAGVPVSERAVALSWERYRHRILRDAKQRKPN